MKTKLLLLSTLFSFILFSCNNDDDTTTPQFESTALIYGFDVTLCGCCGGNIIDIDNNPNLAGRRFTELPAGTTGIDLDNGPFPISVRLNWSNSDEYCGQGIIIESIEAIN